MISQSIMNVPLNDGAINHHNSNSTQNRSMDDAAIVVISKYSQNKYSVVITVLVMRYLRYGEVTTTTTRARDSSYYDTTNHNSRFMLVTRIRLGMD